MAKIEILAPFVLSWEGGYSNVPGDAGGVTNKGVTIATWKIYGYDKNEDDVIDNKDMKLISEYDAIYVIMKPIFWDVLKGDQINDQSVANLIVDWAWNSGRSRVVKKVQKILGVKADGILGPKTLSAINASHGKTLFSKIWKSRENYYYYLVDVNPVNKKFLRGWIRRLNSIQYGKLVYCNGKTKVEF